MGFLTDSFVRNLGLPLVTGDIPGVAVIIGGAEDPQKLWLWPSPTRRRVSWSL